MVGAWAALAGATFLGVAIGGWADGDPTARWLAQAVGAFFVVFGAILVRILILWGNRRTGRVRPLSDPDRTVPYEEVPRPGDARWIVISVCAALVGLGLLIGTSRLGDVPVVLAFVIAAALGVLAVLALYLRPGVAN
jgi:hypothetical protein